MVTVRFRVSSSHQTIWLSDYRTFGLSTLNREVVTGRQWVACLRIIDHRYRKYPVQGLRHWSRPTNRVLSLKWPSWRTYQNRFIPGMVSIRPRDFDHALFARPVHMIFNESFRWKSMIHNRSLQRGPDKARFTAAVFSQPNRIIGHRFTFFTSHGNQPGIIHFRSVHKPPSCRAGTGHVDSRQ